MNQRLENEKAEGRPALEPTPTQTAEVGTIPVVAEELVVDTKAVTTGKVRVHKLVRERTEHIEVPLLQDTVDIQRIVINRVVPAPPPVRKEGSTIIVPVVEEEIVVTKRLILKEEVHLIRRRTKVSAARDVTVRREEAEVERVDSQGRPLPTKVTPEVHRPTPRVRRRSSIIPEN